MKKLLRFMALATALLVLGLCAVTASAKKAGYRANDTVKLDMLANNGYLKLIGRTRIDDGYLSCDFAGAGFSTVVTVDSDTDTEFELYMDTNYSNRISIFVDDEKVLTKEVFGSSTNYGSMIYCTVSPGEHEITVIKESAMSKTATTWFRFVAIRFEGTVDKATPDKDLLVEVIGDSYSCGSHSEAPYQVGATWSTMQDSASTLSFGWYLSKMMNADLREVSLGGQGLDGTEAQETQENTVTMPILYDYMSYLDQAAGRIWTDTRMADLVVIELGANDTKSAENAPNWVSIAKQFLIKLETKYGGTTPIVWNFTNNTSYFYAGLRKAIETDPELSCYGNIYLFLNYLSGNSDPALACQELGHADALDEEEHAERLYHFIEMEGVLGIPEDPVSEHQYIYYVSENGDDSNDGLSRENAKKTVKAATTAARTYAASLGTVPADAEMVIRCSGSVLMTATQSLSETYMASGKVTRADGSVLPLVYETDEYDGTNRAYLLSSYQPTASGAATAYTQVPMILRNVEIHFTKNASSGYECKNIYIQEGSYLEFDNVTLSTDSGGTVQVNAVPFSYTASFHQGICENTAQKHFKIVFKNGVYDATTGYSYISCVGGSGSIYLSGGSKTSAKGLTSEIVVDNGATVDGKLLRLVSSNLSIKEAIITVKTGGKVVNGFTGTSSGTSSAAKAYNENLTVNILGGHIQGYFFMMGNYVNLTGNTNFLMEGGEIYCKGGTSESTNCVVLGGGYNTDTINGNEFKEINGGIIYVVATATKDSSNKAIQNPVFFSGRASQTITGTSKNKMTAGAILFTPESSSVISTGCAVYFGCYSGNIQTELINEIEGGIIDSSQMNSSLYFGTQTVTGTIKKLTNVIGVPAERGRSDGPQFYANGIRLAAGWGQYGRTTKNNAAVTNAGAITSDTVVVSQTIFGGDFHGKVYLTQTGNDSGTTYYPRTEGSVRIYIYGGRFIDETYIVSASQIYGHVEAHINGGYFKTFYGISGTSALITNGLEIEINDLQSFGKLQKSRTNTAFQGPFNIRPLNSGSLQTLGGAQYALTVEVNGGEGKAVLDFNDANNALSGGAASVKVTGGKYESIIGPLATGSVSGGWFGTAPASSFLAPNYGVKNFTQSVDQLYTCYVEASDESVGHYHCDCGHMNTTYGGHVCNAEQEWTPVMAYEDLKNAFSSSGAAEGFYYLVNDIRLKDALTPQANQNIHICLNGHMIMAAPGKRAFMLYKDGATLGATLNITDCQEMGNGCIYGGYHVSNGGNILIGSGCNFNLYGGTITGGTTGPLTVQSSSSYGYGGNLYVFSGCTFRMYGGRITDGITRRHGGNIVVSGTTYLYDGIIKNGRVAASLSDLNAWLIGGNVYNSGTAYIYDAMISGGKANSGGNIYTNSTLTIDGAYIYGGEALTGNGGNIDGDKNSKITVLSGSIDSGKALLRKRVGGSSESYGNGGNIYVQGEFTMTGGSIYDGEAYYMGGGIYFNKDNTTLEGTISGGELFGNKAGMGGNIAIEGNSTATKKVTVSGTAKIQSGLAHHVGMIGGHGGNICLNDYGELTVSGGEIYNGQAEKQIGGGNISILGGCTVLTISGGKIYNAMTSVEEGENDEDVSSIFCFYCDGPQTFTMTGGYLGAVTPEQVTLDLASGAYMVAEVTGGYIEGQISGANTGYIKKVYLKEIVDHDYIHKDSLQFTLDPVEVYDGVSFAYEVAPGFMVYAGTYALEGIVSPANIQGGGIYRIGQTAKLKAPASVGPYKFLRWETEEGTSLTTETTYDITDNSHGMLFYAVYEYEKTEIRLTVVGTNFSIQAKEPTDTAFDISNGLEGTFVRTYPSGTQIVINYTGDRDFAAWTNDTNKFVSTTKGYAFTLYVETKLNEMVSKAVTEAEKKVTILYMNAYDQILKTVDGADYATDIPSVPAMIGKTIVGWDKDTDELGTLIAAVPSGESKVITVLPVYTDDNTEGTIILKKMIDDEEVEGDETTFTGPISRALEVVAEDMEGYTFIGIEDDEEVTLTNQKSLFVRPVAGGRVLYAIYAAEPTPVYPILSITYADVVESGTVQIDVSRALPAGYSFIEQGFLLTNEALGCDSVTSAYQMLYIEKETGFARMVSKTEGPNNIASLKMRNIPAGAVVYVCGYMIYINDETGEIGTIYTYVATMEKDACTIY